MYFLSAAFFVFTLMCAYEMIRKFAGNRKVRSANVHCSGIAAESKQHL